MSRRCPYCGARRGMFNGGPILNAEIESAERERHDRRMPGNARLRAVRAVAVFRASVQKAKLEARRKKSKVRSGSSGRANGR